MKKNWGIDCRHWLILAAILAIALGLRLWGIGFGLPHRYHIDEAYTVLGALRTASGDFSPRQPPNSPNLWEFILLVEYGLLFVAGKLGNVYQSVWEFAESYRVDPTRFYLLARGSNALLGTATVAVVYKAARDIYCDRRAGLLAALFLAVAFLLGREAHYAVPDTFAVFLTTAGVYLWARHAQGGSASALWLGSFVIGVAVGLKWRPLGLIPGLLTAVWLHQRMATGAPIAGRHAHWRPLERLLIAGLVLVAGFFVGFPALFISLDLFKWHLDQILPDIRWVLRLSRPATASAPGSATEFTGLDYVPLPGWRFNLDTLAWGLGLPLLLTSLGGVARALRWRRPGELTILASALGFYAVISLSGGFLRYALPLHPLLVILAGGFVAAASHSLQRRWSTAGRVASAALIIGLVILPAARLVRHDYLLTQTDTRTLAKAWLEAHVPDGASIAMEWPVHSPPLSTPGDPEPNSTGLYNVTTVGGIGLQSHPPEWYRKQGIEYLVATSFIYNIPMRGQAENSERLAFYASLEQEFELVQEFWPNETQAEPSFVIDEIFGPVISLWQRDRPGPTLKVYRIGH